MIVTLILLLTALLFTGCSSDGVAKGSSIDKGIVALEKWKVEGVSQKGPFINGSTVKILELGELPFTQTGKIFESSIDSDKGNFSISGTALVSPYVLLEVHGFYRNEVTGKMSPEPLTLNGITDLSNRETVNINLLTHLEFDRTMNLTSKGKSFSEAKAQAEREVLSAMAMSESEEAFEDLNIFESGDENAKLLAISILLQGDEDVAEFTERIAKIAIEMGQSGSWNDSLTKTAIADWACDRKQRNMYAIIRENILKWGFTDSLPDFEKYTNMFWADNYGLGKCSESNKGDTAQNTNPLSKRVGEKFTCDGSSWVTTDISLYKGEFGTLTDERDGQIYRTVKIGEQVWMAENLNYNYQTGKTRSFCFEDNEKNCARFGKLYTFAGAVDSAGLFGDGGLDCSMEEICVDSNCPCNLKESSRGVCPEGWHIPSRGEWEQLIAAVGGKIMANTVLRNADGIGTDDYGFNIIPIRSYYNENYKDNATASFWTSTSLTQAQGTLQILQRRPYYLIALDGNKFDDCNYTPDTAYSVRCVMD